MGKIGKGIHTTENEDRIFVSPDVDRYERKDGGEVIVVPEVETDDSAGEEEE